MSAFIKINTMEYPRHAGDIALDSSSIYEPVLWVDKPQFDRTTQKCREIFPEKVDGVWYMRWIVEDYTQEELDAIAVLLEKNERTP